MCGNSYNTRHLDILDQQARREAYRCGKSNPIAVSTAKTAQGRTIGHTRKCLSVFLAVLSFVQCTIFYTIVYLSRSRLVQFARGLSPIDLKIVLVAHFCNPCLIICVCGGPKPFPEIPAGVPPFPQRCPWLFLAPCCHSCSS